MSDDEIRQYYDILPEGHKSLPERYRDLETEHAALRERTAAIVAALTAPRAGETFGGTGVIVCLFCRARSLLSHGTGWGEWHQPPVEHGPSCLVTLAHQLRDQQTAESAS